MAELKLFKVGNEVKELKSSSATIEKELQNTIEKNMYDFFGVRFLQSEYRIDNGRMDSIGIDENNCPVIFEYKCHSNENVINQGLFYLNWLLEHKANFKLLVIEKLGIKEAEEIDWSMPRVICIAGDFNKYDEEAIKQINRNVSLIRYKKYENDLLLFELLNTNTVAPLETEKDGINRYFFICIKPDGSFIIQEQENTLFEMNEYSAYVDIFEEAKTRGEKIKGIIKTEDGMINVIKDSGMFTVPEID